MYLSFHSFFRCPDILESQGNCQGKSKVALLHTHMYEEKCHQSLKILKMFRRVMYIPMPLSLKRFASSNNISSLESSIKVLSKGLKQLCSSFLFFLCILLCNWCCISMCLCIEFREMQLECCVYNRCFVCDHVYLDSGNRVIHTAGKYCDEGGNF